MPCFGYTVVDMFAVDFVGVNAHNLSVWYGRIDEIDQLRYLIVSNVQKSQVWI